MVKHSECQSNSHTLVHKCGCGLVRMSALAAVGQNGYATVMPKTVIDLSRHTISLTQTHSDTSFNLKANATDVYTQTQSDTASNSNANTMFGTLKPV